MGYKTQEDFKSKINALEFHKTRVEKLINIKQKVEKILFLEENFFANSYDSEILQLQRDLKIKMHELSLSLISLQKEVIEYINRSIKKVSFWQKVIRLKELRDNFELKEKTDILVLCEENMPLKFSNLSTNFKTNLNQDLIYETNYQEIIKKLLKNRKLKKVEQKYASKIDDILEHLVFHISNVKEIKDYEKTKNDIKKIRRYLKQIPVLILKNIIQLSHHIGLVYKTQEDFKSKINALEFHKTRVEKLINIKQKVEKILFLEENFFANSYDSEILQLQRDLKIKMHELSLSLISLQKEVIEYINRSIKKVSFWQKVIRLKELRDNFELKEKTDILVLCEENMPLKFSNLSTNFKTNLNQDLIYETNYQEIIKKLLK